MSMHTFFELHGTFELNRSTCSILACAIFGGWESFFSLTHSLPIEMGNSPGKTTMRMNGKQKHDKWKWKWYDNWNRLAYNQSVSGEGNKRKGNFSITFTFSSLLLSDSDWYIFFVSSFSSLARFFSGATRRRFLNRSKKWSFSWIDIFN